MDVDYEEGLPDDSDERVDIEYSINARKARKKLADLDMEVESEEEEVIEEQPELPMDMPMEEPKGLMARRGEVL